MVMVKYVTVLFLCNSLLYNMVPVSIRIPLVCSKANTFSLYECLKWSVILIDARTVSLKHILYLRSVVPFFQKYIHKLWYSDSNCLSYIYYLFLSVLWSFYLEKIIFFTQIWLEINDLIFLYFYLPCGIHVYLPCGIHVPNHITKMLLYRYMQCKLQLFVLHNIVFNVLSDNKKLLLQIVEIWVEK